MDIKGLRKGLVDRGVNAKLFAHLLTWFTGKSPSHDGYVNYKSFHPWTIKRQLDAMQSVGFDGVIALWDGDGLDIAAHIAVLQVCFQCEQRGMLFALMLNNTMVKFRPDQSVLPENEVINRLSCPQIQELLKSPAYIPQKYVLEFDVSTLVPNWATVVSAFPNLNFLSRHKGFSWPEITNTIQQLKADNAKPDMKVPAIFAKYFDGKPGDWSHWVWNAPPPAPQAPSRYIPSMGGDTYCDTLDAIPQNAELIEFVTWNDYNEGTDKESEAVQETGVRL